MRTITCRQFLLSAGAVVVLVFACSSDDNPKSASCKTTSDCDAEPDTEGYLCVSKACIPCESTEECNGTVYYGSLSVCRSGRCSDSTQGVAGSGHGTAGKGSGGGRGATEALAGGTAGKEAGGSSQAAAGAGASFVAAQAGNSASGLGGSAVAVGGAVTGSGGAIGASGGVDAAAGNANVSGAGGIDSTAAGGVAGTTGMASLAGAAGASSAVCAANSALLPGGGCKACGTCDKSIPGLTGNLYPKTTQDGMCVCETKDGYYSTKALQSAPELCDADDDGWLRITAAQGLESTDPAIKANARCELRRVEEVKLINDAGQSKSNFFNSDLTGLATIPGGLLPLYESVANDGGTRAADQSLPTYGSGTGARTLTPVELNSLTKACINSKADHNGNGLADVAEWEKMVPPTTTSGLGDYLKMYTRLSYFLELHSAWFTGTRSQEGASVGTYTIEERKRVASSDGTGVGIIADTSQQNTEDWRTCDRKRDSVYSDNAPGTTFDFASASLPGADWTGMNHHSQFKCVAGVSSDIYSSMLTESDHAVALHQQTASSLSVRKWYGNSCQASDSIAATAADRTNPAMPKIVCSPSSALPLEEARWVSVTYVDVDETKLDSYGYVRGCICECKDKVPAVVIPTCRQCEDLAWGKQHILATPEDSHTTGCVAPLVCDGKGGCGACVPGRTRCKDTTTQQICQNDQSWKDAATPCQYKCNADTGTCNETCTPACPTGTECVASDQCLKSNGQTCAQAAECASSACSTYYRDADGDGYQGSSGNFCGATPPSGWTSTPTAIDCCDKDSNAHPGQTGWFATVTGCGGFDYNCSGPEEKQDTVITDCDFVRVGWIDAAPACGAQGTWATSCNCVAESGGCIVSSQPKVQSCH